MDYLTHDLSHLIIMPRQNDHMTDYMDINPLNEKHLTVCTIIFFFYQFPSIFICLINRTKSIPFISIIISSYNFPNPPVFVLFHSIEITTQLFTCDFFFWEALQRVWKRSLSDGCLCKRPEYSSRGSAWLSTDTMMASKNLRCDVIKGRVQTNSKHHNLKLYFNCKACTWMNLVRIREVVIY